MKAKSFTNAFTAALGAALALTLAAPPASIAQRLPEIDDHAGHISHYTCSMHPSVHTATPGSCPICSMDLIPVSVEETRSGAVRVSDERRRVIGVTTAAVERKAVEFQLRAAARVTWDETRLSDVTLKVHGWVGEVFANHLGIAVEAGDPLFTVYAPELLSAQEEYLEGLRRSKGSGATRLLDNTKRRLRLWGLSPAAIARLGATGMPREYVTIHAPTSGVVIGKTIVAGSPAEVGQRLIRIADPTRVWVEASIFEGDLPLVAVGQEATITVPSQPGEPLKAPVAWIAPDLDPSTRSGRLRLEIPNPLGRLRPDTFATVELSIPLGEQLVVPVSAVMIAGERNVVFRDLGDGRLEARRIEVGTKTADGYVVRKGLEEGDIVVTSGNFLIAAESRLKGGDSW